MTVASRDSGRCKGPGADRSRRVGARTVWCGGCEWEPRWGRGSGARSSVASGEDSESWLPLRARFMGPSGCLLASGSALPRWAVRSSLHPNGAHPTGVPAALFTRAVCCRDALGARVPCSGRARAAAEVEARGAEPERGASCSRGALCRAGREPELASTGRASGGHETVLAQVALEASAGVPRPPRPLESGPTTRYLPLLVPAHRAIFHKLEKRPPFHLLENRCRTPLFLGAAEDCRLSKGINLRRERRP